MGKTFRDPAATLELHDHEARRHVRPGAEVDLLRFMQAPQYAALVEQRRIVATVVKPPPNHTEPLLLVHPLIWFRSFPWEWPPALWLAAADLTLDLCCELIDQGWILKDATPLNVLFQGAQPIFVDLPSIQPMDLSCPLWWAYAQFVRTFLLPVLAYAQLGWPLQDALLRRDGYEPEEIYNALPWGRRLKRAVFGPVTMPVVMGRMVPSRTGRPSGFPASFSQDPQLVKQVVQKNIRAVQQSMHRAVPPPATSRWSGYAENTTHYGEQDGEQKKQFVRDAFLADPPRRVLDVGCNAGIYANLAADAGASVVAIDVDVEVVNRLALQTQASGKDILPLCVNLAQPTPAVGWDNEEYPSFLDRCEGQFDAVLMLAVVHHLLLTDQVPLERIAALASRLTTHSLVIEWVPPSDPLFQQLLRGRDEIYAHIDEDAFRAAFGEHFEIHSETALSNGRILLLMKKPGTAS